MATLAADRAASADLAQSVAYTRFAGIAAILAGIAGFIYSVAFVILRSDTLSALSLMLAGLAGSAALVGVYGLLKKTDASFALWALLLGVGGALGSAIHGAYDLSNALHPPATVNLDLPSQVDPRGLLTFGVAGLALWVV